MTTDPWLWIAVAACVAAVFGGIWLHRHYPAQSAAAATDLTHALLLDVKNAIVSLENAIHAHLQTMTIPTLTNTVPPPVPTTPVVPTPPIVETNPFVPTGTLAGSSKIDQFYATHKQKE